MRTTMTRLGSAIVLGLAGLAMVACGGTVPDETARSSTAGPPVTVSVATAELASLATWTESTATVEPWRRVMPGTKILGRIERVDVREGDRVAAGQRLARLEQVDLEAAVAQARAAVAMAERR